MLAGDFKDIISGLRWGSDITQGQLAKELGVSRSTVVGYENGTRYPDYKTLKKIAEYFGVSGDYLLGRSRVKVFWDDIVEAVEANPALGDLLRYYCDPEYTTFFEQLSKLTEPQIKKVREIISVIFAPEDDKEDSE